MSLDSTTECVRRASSTVWHMAEENVKTTSLSTIRRSRRALDRRRAVLFPASILDTWYHQHADSRETLRRLSFIDLSSVDCCFCCLSTVDCGKSHEQERSPVIQSSNLKLFQVNIETSNRALIGSWTSVFKYLKRETILW